MVVNLNFEERRIRKGIVKREMRIKLVNRSDECLIKLLEVSDNVSVYDLFGHVFASINLERDINIECWIGENRLGMDVMFSKLREIVRNIDETEEVVVLVDINVQEIAEDRVLFEKYVSILKM